MNQKRILLTGDDGYKAIGIRLLIHYFKDTCDLTVVATKTQQSATGGKLHVQHGCAYRETTVDGVRAFWVDGAPADAMEFAGDYFSEPFDLIISGMNLGENIGSAIISSGTVMGAMRGIGLQVAPQAIALSWMTPGDFYFKPHDERENLTEYLRYPGETVAQVVSLCINEKLWGAKFLNINFPQNRTQKVRFSRLVPTIRECYPPILIDESTNMFSYPFGDKKRPHQHPDRDLDAIESGYVSITPVETDWTNEKVWSTIGKKEIQLA